MAGETCIEVSFKSPHRGVVQVLRQYFYFKNIYRKAAVYKALYWLYKNYDPRTLPLGNVACKFNAVMEEEDNMNPILPMLL
jgi:hypothetical protein